jgi:beta-xylosidase
VRNILISLLATAAAMTPAAAKAPPAIKPFVPTFTTDFPDPFILPQGDLYLAYATNPSGLRANVQMATSINLVDWQLLTEADGKLHDAMPRLPAWAKPGFTWAPEVVRVGTGYLLYFTARERTSDLQCVGVARSNDPRGPFLSNDAAPLVCQREEGGTIDPSAFTDADGQRYLYYKSDGNNPRVLRPSRIFAQKLSADGLRLAGDARPLLVNDKHWEWRVVESPTMIRNPGGSYTLFFSANHFGWESDQRLSNYAMGYARCETAVGPCTKAPENPILYSYNTLAAGCLSGPGHQTVFQRGDRKFLVFHAWSATLRCESARKGRYMYIAPLGWNGDKPVIANSLR